MTIPRPHRENILELCSQFMNACVIGAAAELDLFSVVGAGPVSLEELASRLRGDRRGLAILADAVAGLGLLEKTEGRYRVPAELLPLLTEASSESILPMIRHRANMLRAWANLAWTAKAGMPAPRTSSLRGPAGDRAAFVAAMHNASAPVADALVAELGPPPFTHLLDVGGASGTWTLAFLRAVPEARATIFDLPDAIAQARARIELSEMGPRITLAPGDFYVDALPSGADYAWVSAIAHQQGREENRRLFQKVFAALVPGGRIGIRDVVMEPSRIAPVDGALFAVNMLVQTETGGTFTLDEFAEDLESAGFVDPVLRVRDDGMNSVVEARKESR